LFWGIEASSPLVASKGIRVVVLSKLVRVAIPSLLISSIPQRAIGFSYPRGREGLIAGAAMLSLTFIISYALAASLGPVAVIVSLWFFGVTAGVMLYNVIGSGLAFVKPLCSTCRLLPLIEEHEAIHLSSGVASEGRCWEDAKKRYSYAGLGLGSDPRICSFCPIAKRLREP
jgi:hypothetical protein